MLFVEGGIAKLIEHWVEQYHQVGCCYDLSYCWLGLLKKQAEIHSRMEKRARHPRVKMDKKSLEDIRKSRKTRRTKQQERAVKKKEKQEKAVEEVKLKLENMSAEEAIKLMDTIEVLIDLEEIQQLEDEMGNQIQLQNLSII